MGVMKTVKILRQLLDDWTLPDEMTVTWDMDNPREVAYAAAQFHAYLADGWLAFSEESQGRRQIFAFDPQLERIVLLPPLGGG